MFITMEVKIKKIHCYRCGHDWVPRKSRVVICPKCKSPYFDREKKSKRSEKHLTIDKLAESQNVKPMVDMRALFCTWPGGEDDDFEEAINELRHRNTAGEERKT